MSKSANNSIRQQVEVLNQVSDTATDRRVKTGSAAFTRTHLEEIKSLRAEGHGWRLIAAAVAALGVTQGDGVPITGRRLAALVSAVEKQAARQERKLEVRRQRRDLVNPGRSSRLSPDLSDFPRPKSSPAGSLSEEQLRRERLADVEDLFATTFNPHRG